MTAEEGMATPLAQVVPPLAQAHPARSGLVALRDGREAFAARALLADAARHTIEAQYYIWHNDLSGTLLFEALHRAADRGVQVRLLLDDQNTAGLDRVLGALAAHPRVELRLFNPFRLRRWRWVNFLTDFARLNRRMHNKSFTADRQVTIVGGRNVGDEYFDAGQQLSFVDLDVLAIGPVVDAVADDFERYWSCGSARPASEVLPAVDATTIAELAADAAKVERDPAALAYTEALARTPFVRDLLCGRLAFEWAETQIVSDDPAKGLGLAVADGLLWSRLERMLKAPTRELELVSPYFVPTAAGRRLFRGIGAPRREDHGADERARSHRCAGGACRLCETAQGAARGRHRAVRDEAAGVVAALLPGERQFGVAACMRRRSRSIARTSSSARSTSIRARPT